MADEDLRWLHTEVEEGAFAWDETIETREETEGSAPEALTYHTSRDLFQAQAALLDTLTVSLSADPETYRLVRAHLGALERWHEQHTGWRIQRGPGFFRLERHLYRVAPVYLDDKLKRARDFVCLTWLLWFAEKRHLDGGGRNQQFLLSQLADELQQQSKETADTGRALDFRNQQDRYSMWRALDYLTRLGGLQTLEGEVKKWAEDSAQQDGEVLYEFTPVAHSLIEALNMERVTAMATLLNEQGEQLPTPGVLSPLAQRLPAILRAWRALLLGPALLRYDDPVAFAALREEAEQVSNELSRSFGWLLELNDDYACVVRGSSLSAGAGPALTLNGAHDQMLLLLCTALRQQVEQGTWAPDSYGCLHLSHWDITPLFNDLRLRYSSYWGASVRESKGAELLEEIYRRMRLLGLLRGPDAQGRLLILPTVARYSVSYSQEPPEERAKTAPTRKDSRKRARVERPAFDWTSAEDEGAAQQEG